jgi:DNA-binding transcriptional LysR family regulator
MPELRALRAFAAVARRGSFTGAGQELFVAQQAVSRTVAGLERELGVRLLERTTRNVRLTPAGSALLADTERILAEVAAAVDRVRSVGRGQRGLLRIGLTPAITDDEATWLADAIRTDQPGVAVALSDVRPGSVIAQLSDGALDVVVARTLARSSRIATRRIGTVPAALAVASSHRLAGRDSVDLSGLDGERLICWSRPGSRYTRLLVALARRAGAEVQTAVSSVTGRDGLADVAQGSGVALVALTRRPRRGVAIIPIRPAVLLPITAAWRRDPSSAIVQLFLAAVTARRVDAAAPPSAVV